MYIYFIYLTETQLIFMITWNILPKFQHNPIFKTNFECKNYKQTHNSTKSPPPLIYIFLNITVNL